MNILVINGPNTNMLGAAQTEIFGNTTLGDIEKKIKEAALGSAKVSFFQSNHEGAIVDKIQSVMGKASCILINAGAYTHTSVAIRDALLGTAIPFFEIHISNVHAREEFRHHSYLSDKAVGVIVGFGLDGYEFALRKAARLVNK